MQATPSWEMILDQQHQFFLAGKTLPVDFRIDQLKKLKALIQQFESRIIQALYLDLHKAQLESEVNEILLVYKEIDFCIKHLKKWVKPKKVTTPFPILWPGRSEIHHEPYGTVFIIAPWNYPFLLTISPLIGAISAGNCAIIKPSELASRTQKIILELINQHFPSEFIYAVEADAKASEELLKHKFDYIFFTGGTQIGKMVMSAAAKHLTPVTLELGGKNPCIVDKDANLDFAARRIAWAKTTNAGQVCLAPDYLYVHESRKNEFIEKLKNTLRQFYGQNAEESNSYGRIINQKHFLRLTSLMQNKTILFGGQSNSDTLFIAPTLIDNVTWDDPIMQEEIFGPLLPIMTFEHIDQVIQTIKPLPKPLALYLFTHNNDHEKKVLSQLSFGGGCVNDCILQIANLHLPFGGIGESGMGSYHGKYSFETFSHQKSIYKKTYLFDLKLEYPPFTAKKLGWIKTLFKLG